MSRTASIVFALILWPGSAMAQYYPDYPSRSSGRVAVQERQLVIRVLRLPPMSRPLPPTMLPPRRGAPRIGQCVRVKDLAPIAFTRPVGVDFTLVSNRRLRVELEGRCTALDFYAGLYIRPRQDGRICALRDALYARSGAVCPIRALRFLAAGE